VERVSRHWTVLLLAGVAAATVACGQTAPASAPASTPATTPLSPPVFTTAHRTTGDAVRDFFGVRPAPKQPIQFPHAVHIAKGLTCTDYCHESVSKGPIAGLPSVTTCMICHDSIAKTRPTIQKIADYQKRGIDIPWQRVYGYTAEAHVRFNHAPHIRAGVECATCHGNVAAQAVAERVVDLSMGFCINCHKARQASNDCLTCHF
jgi:hypothetical protein